MTSMRQVAAHAGTSVSTVSHVVHGTRYVSPEMTMRVLAAMTTLDFSPAPKPSRQRSSASKVFGLIVSDIANPFFSEVAEGFEQAALRHGFECSLAETDYCEGRLVQWGHRLVDHGVAGVAAMTSEMDSRLVRALRRRHIPSVFLDAGPLDEASSWVGIDYESGIEAALLHLYHLGHQTIGFICGPMEYVSIRQRRDAFESVARELRMRTVIAKAALEAEGGEVAVQQLMRHVPRPTALVTCNDLMAMGALRTLARLGLRVPRDVSLIGFDNIGLTTVAQPPLTTIEVAPRKLGIIAMEALRQMVTPPSGLPIKGREYRLPCRLIVRQSTAAVSRKF